MEERLSAALNSLSKTIREVRSLIAWRALELSEAKPGVPPSFSFRSSTDDDLRLKIGLFYKDYFEILEVMNQLPQEQTSELRKKLESIYASFQRLQLPKGL